MWQLLFQFRLFFFFFFFRIVVVGWTGTDPFYTILPHFLPFYPALSGPLRLLLSLSPFLSSFHSVSAVEETLSFSTGNLRVVSPLFLVFKQPNISSNNTEKYQIKLRTHFHTPKKEKKKNKKITDLQQL